MTGLYDVKLRQGDTMSVQLHATFEREIAGERFRFAVYDSIDDKGETVTVAEYTSSKRAASFKRKQLPRKSKALFFTRDRYTHAANVALDEVIEKHGAERVRSVLAGAT